MAGAKAVAAVEEEVEAVAEEEAEAEEEEATVVVAAVTKAVAAVVVAAAALAVAARVAEAEAEVEVVASPLHPSCCPRIPRTTRGSHQTRARYQWRRQLLNRHGHCPQRAGARAESAPWLLSQPSTPSRGGRPKAKMQTSRTCVFDVKGGKTCLCECVSPACPRDGASPPHIRTLMPTR